MNSYLTQKRCLTQEASSSNLRTMRKNLLLITLALLFIPVASFGYYSNIDTAELLKPGEYNAGFEPQYIFDNYPGVNFIGHFDMGATDTGNLKFVVGSGRTSFQGGAFYKIVPIPDIEGQPGIGIFGGLLYAYQNTSSALNFRLHPEISKKFKSVDAGEITPYGAIPFGIDFTGNNTLYPVNLALGARWLPPNLKHMHFWSEFGFELDSAAFTYISLGISIPFSSTDPFTFD
jgi:hypothetical protein